MTNEDNYKTLRELLNQAKERVAERTPLQHAISRFELQVSMTYGLLPESNHLTKDDIRKTLLATAAVPIELIIPLLDEIAALKQELDRYTKRTENDDH